jgi:hypothetical protein
VLGLLVSRDGYPLSYSIFNGSQYEGYTMIPTEEQKAIKQLFEMDTTKAD